VRVYTNDEFYITDLNITYYRKPTDVLFKDCINFNNNFIVQDNVESDFKDDIVEIIVDQAAAILAGDIESITQFQRQQQAVQTNS
jgi:hypothetical protein